MRSYLVAVTVVLLPLAAQAVTVSDETQVLSANAGESASFGYAAAASGSMALIGAYGHGFADSDAGLESGAAYLFDADTGNRIHTLTASDGATGDQFGFAAGLSGATAVVGAHMAGDVGAVYVFDSVSGLQQHKLTASDAATMDRFGVSVGVSGSTAVVGARGKDDAGANSGAAYIFDTVTGAQTQKLTATDAAAGDFFGRAVAVDGTTAIVGAYGDDDSGMDSGAAYLFDATTGAQLHKLTPDDGAANDRFGTSVAISGTLALVGSYLDDDNGTSSGAAYLFDTVTGKQLSKLTASDGEAYDYFGRSVAIAGDYALIGANGDDDGGTDGGAAYLFQISTGLQIAKILASDGTHGDDFGYSVAISDDISLVGAGFANLSNPERGYVYQTTDVIAAASISSVPLPAGFWLLGSALCFLGFRRRV